MNAYNTAETAMSSQRLTFEMVREPLLGSSQKLVLTLMVSRSAVGRPSYSASAYEAPVFPLPKGLFGSSAQHLSNNEIYEASDSSSQSSLGIVALVTTLRTMGVDVGSKP